MIVKHGSKVNNDFQCNNPYDRDQVGLLATEKWINRMTVRTSKVNWSESPWCPCVAEPRCRRFLWPVPLHRWELHGNRNQIAGPRRDGQKHPGMRQIFTIWSDWVSLVMAAVCESGIFSCDWRINMSYHRCDWWAQDWKPGQVCAQTNQTIRMPQPSQNISQKITCHFGFQSQQKRKNSATIKSALL